MTPSKRRHGSHLNLEKTFVVPLVRNIGVVDQTKLAAGAVTPFSGACSDLGDSDESKWVAVVTSHGNDQSVYDSSTN